jgi:hypothetical protein
MKKLLIIPIIFVGCVNKKGISLEYYDNCKEQYGLFGVYYYECPNNIINFKSKQKNPMGIKKDCLGCN